MAALCGTQMNHKTQVHKQIASALTALVVLYGAVLMIASPIKATDSIERLVFAAKLLGFLSLPLLCGIGLTVVARYNDASLIQGYKAVSERLEFIRAYNTNTLEQTTVHALSVVAYCVVVPQQWLVFALAQVLAFILGRLFFYFGYRRAALQRFFGFVMGYYPAIVAVLTACVFAIVPAYAIVQTN
jgi:hypothetical protein